MRTPGTDLAPPGVLPPLVEQPANVLVLRGHGSTVLVDAGDGILRSWFPAVGPGLAGLEPPTLIVLTHLDFDHAGGVLAGSWPHELRPAFPDVPVVMLADAVAGARRREPDAPWNSATRCVQTLESAGVLREVKSGEEVAPGVRLVAAPGHRSGHAVVEIGEALIHLADVVHHSLHVAHPDWEGKHDGRPDEALVTRVEVLERAATGGHVCVASHIRGAGRIERVDDALAWAGIESPLDEAS
jgi:glyoxylase-like metal-dependent hydrolase (beta-lactamase superfamily II)